MNDEPGGSCLGCIVWIVAILALLTLAGWVFQQVGINQ